MKTKKNITAKPTVTKTALKEAYQLVQTDLLNTFCQMKDQQVIRLPNIGTFEKQKQQLKSALTGRLHTYYQIKFRMSQTLKKALD